jgi:xanthine dehydrogenase accessory factor
MDSGFRAALATVIRTGGSTPQTPGARLLLRADGSTVGTVGGGAIERAVLGALATCLGDGRPRTLSWELAQDLGMCCGGRMEVFVEPIEGRDRLVIFGAGHVAEPTAGIAALMGFEVIVVDEREELNSEARFRGATRLLLEPDDALRQLSPRESDWFLVVTHDHQLDGRALELVIRGPHRYAGLIGSKRKIIRVLERLGARGGLPSLERVYAPVGLDVGAVSPAEIAVAIMAEVVALKHGRAASHMRAIDDPALARAISGGSAGSPTQG